MIFMILNSKVRKYLHQFLEHFANPSATDRRNRFFFTINPSAIRDWLLVTTEQVGSHYFFVKENLRGQFEGVVVLGISNDGTKGDLAISILPECRNKGLGKQLLRKAINVAKDIGLDQLSFECLMSNKECQCLFQKLGFSCKYDKEQQCLIGYLNLENTDD